MESRQRRRERYRNGDFFFQVNIKASTAALQLKQKASIAANDICSV